MYWSKQQGTIETSTYGAEFVAMKTAVKEVYKPSRIIGDNCSVIINSTVPSSSLKKNHVAISYHMACKTTAAHIVHPLKTKVTWNFSDVLTKPTTRKGFASL
eukprot:3144084-Ditylum_brightwellii.AAC.1